MNLNFLCPSFSALAAIFFRLGRPDAEFFDCVAVAAIAASGTYCWCKLVDWLVRPLSETVKAALGGVERAMPTTGYEQPGDPAFEGGAAFERYQEEQEAYRNSIIEQCAKAAIGVPMPRYGTNARFTGRAEMQGWIVKAIRALATPPTKNGQ